MSMLRSMVRGAMSVGVGVVVATAIGCMSADESEATGVAQVAITQVPFDGSVGCIAVTATGGVTVTRSTDVSPGSSTVLSLNGLPTGTVSFTGNAYAGACAQVSPATVPTWISDPVLATVGHVPITVTLSMKRNGQATVGVDFDDSSSCRAPGAPCLSGAECCSNVCSGNTCQDACQADGGTCGGCSPGLVLCGAQCTDVSSDPFNCGFCGAVCPPGAACVAGACLQTPTCTDGMRNGYETDVDCGGPDCVKCSTGKGCAFGGDCASSVCQNGICAAPSCTDMVKNGYETDLDCGGSCAPCMTGKMCLAAPDCVSGICVNNLCQ